MVSIKQLEEELAQTTDLDDRTRVAELIEQRKRVGWIFWLCWVLATTVGYTVGQAVHGVLVRFARKRLVSGVIRAMGGTVQ